MQRIEASHFDEAACQDMVRLLLEGGIVCVPTDTLYGLAVDATNNGAVERLNRLKGRTSGTPMIVLVDSLSAVRQVCMPPADFDALATRFWPGPISLIMEARADVPRLVVSHQGSIAVRWPRSPLIGRLVGALGRPITSTSANRTGGPVARSADEVARVLPEIDFLVDGGTMPDRTPSTLVDLTTEPPSVCREGAVPWSQLHEFFAGHLERRPA